MVDNKNLRISPIGDIKVFAVLTSVIYTIDNTPIWVGVPASLILMYWYILSSRKSEVYFNKSMQSVDNSVGSLTSSRYWYFLQPIWYLFLTLGVSFLVLY